MKNKVWIFVIALLIVGFIALSSSFVRASFGFANLITPENTTYGYNPMGGYGRMGGYGMMGGNWDEDDYCFNIDGQATSYEWLYAHLNDEDQQIVDALYLEMVEEVDFTILSDAEKLVAIENIKTNLIIFIEESDFVLTYPRP